MPIWPKVEGQILSGEDDFTERFKNYVTGHEDIKEIARNQRFLHRPNLEWLFSTRNDSFTRNQKIPEAIEVYGYSQKDIADHLAMHYSSISRILRIQTMSKSKT